MSADSFQVYRRGLQKTARISKRNGRFNGGMPLPALGLDFLLQAI